MDADKLIKLIILPHKGTRVSNTLLIVWILFIPDHEENLQNMYPSILFSLGQAPTQPLWSLLVDEGIDAGRLKNCHEQTRGSGSMYCTVTYVES